MLHRHGDAVFEERDGICAGSGRRERDAGIDIEMTLILEQDTVTGQASSHSRRTVVPSGIAVPAAVDSVSTVLDGSAV